MPGADTFGGPADVYDRFVGRYGLSLATALTAGARPGMRALDVGCGPGALAAVLADRLGGSSVAAVDPSPQFVKACRERLPDVDVREAPAEALPFEDGSVDAALLLGPLYHLPERSDRQAALSEAKRILRPEGLAFAAGISRYAGVLDGLVVHPAMDDQIVTMRQRAVGDGRYRNDTDNLRYFTTAYFHRPEDLARELRAAGFQGARVLGVEGPGWLLADFDARWAEPVTRERILQVARLVEEEPSIVGVSAHLLGIARRP